MIYHRGGEPERAMQLNVMAHKPWITAEFVTVWCSCRHERGKQYFVQPFLRSIKLLRLHTRFKRHTEVMSWISHAYGVDYAWTDLKQTQQLPCMIYTVCKQPAFVMVHSCQACVNLSRLRSSAFMLTLHSGSSPSPMRQWAGHIACTKLPVGLPEIFKCAHLKFTVYGRKQTCTQLPQMQCGARSGSPQLGFQNYQTYM